MEATLVSATVFSNKVFTVVLIPLLAAIIVVAVLIYKKKKGIGTLN